jgi:muramidase (phage lysozyme)
MAWEDSPASGLHPNLERFLGFLGKAEGADYNTIVGGSSFSDFSRHPAVVGLRTKEGPSTAAGRYQITKTTYDDVAPRIGITDFSQKSQDLLATELIRRKGALEDVISGNFNNAINKLGGTWASLPSSPYSQPKRDWNFVKTNLTASSAGWEDAPDAPKAGGGGWEDAPAPARAAAPRVAPQDARGPSPTPAKPKTRTELALEAAQGAGDTLTFGYLDEIAGKGASMLGFDGNKVRDTLRQRAKDAGPAYTAGQVGGAFVPGLGTIGAIRAVPTASRLIRGAAGAGTGAVQGGLYGTGSADGDIKDRLEQGAIGAGVGALAGGALGTVLPATLTQKGNAIIKNAGSDDAARFDAEIIKDLRTLADSPTKRGNPMTTIDANAIETKYINDVNAALTRVGRTQDVSAVREAIMNRRALTPEDLTAIRGSAAGDAAADAIEKAQRLRSLTQAQQSSGGLFPLLREGVDLLPIPAAINRGLKAALGGRETREVAIQKALKQADAADNVLERLGPSRATQSMEALGTTIERAQQAAAAQRAAQEAARAAQQAQSVQNRIQVLQDTRRPLSGAFQELLPGGRSNLNLTSQEAIDALRLTSRQFKERPVGQAAQDILRSGNVSDEAAFYGLQNQIRRLQENGILGNRAGGALSEASAASPIRNPVSYAEAVRTAGAAADLARANAPSKELAQFATRVAGIKSPDAKAKAVADRLAKSSDPTEQAFLTQFVEPLAQFGKK